MSQQIGEFETEVDSQLENAKNSNQEFYEFVETVKSSLSERKTNLIGEVEEFEQGVKQKLESVVNDFANLVQEGNNHL